MTRIGYGLLLADQGIIGCRALWFCDSYIARIPYCCIDLLYNACQWGEPC